MKNRLLKIIILMLTIGVILLGLLYNGVLRFNYPSKSEFPILGIDVSHHQGGIDWAKLIDEDISFVFIKATEGVDFKDVKFQENWNNAINSNLYVGAYHFYRFCKNGKDQALNFIETVPIYNNSMPPAIDLEFGGNCKTNKSQDQIIDEIDNYISIISEHYKMTPIIYATKDFYDQFVINNFQECHIWIRNIYYKPKLQDNREWLFWQYTNRAHLKGINGYVDLNVFNGNKEDLIKLNERHAIY